LVAQWQHAGGTLSDGMEDLKRALTEIQTRLQQAEPEWNGIEALNESLCCLLRHQPLVEIEKGEPIPTTPNARIALRLNIEDIGLAVVSRDVAGARDLVSVALKNLAAIN